MFTNQGKFVFNKPKTTPKKEVPPTQEEKPKEISLKASVNKAIDVQRDGAVPLIKSASESTIWKRRLQKGKRTANQLTKSQKCLTITFSDKGEGVETPKLSPGSNIIKSDT